MLGEEIDRAPAANGETGNSSMLQSVKSTDQGDEEFSIDKLVADIVSKKVSVFDLLRSAPSGDYFAFVQRARLLSVLSKDVRFLEHLQADLRRKMVEAGHDPDNESIAKELARKDGKRRFQKLVDDRAQDLNSGPSLLTGTTFDECLGQYKTILGHVEKLWSDACQLYTLANFPLAAFLSILVIEEVGKLAKLAQDLILYDVPRATTRNGAVERSHRRKQFHGAVSGALINARLDRVLGKDVIRKLLHEAESDDLEKTRQSCLYTDLQDGRATIPGERIDAERARQLTVFAGELMAEVLGYFPWEFERMLDNVIAFERAIGMPEAKIDRR